jgi:hypothetical protein
MSGAVAVGGASTHSLSPHRDTAQFGDGQRYGLLALAIPAPLAAAGGIQGLRVVVAHRVAEPPACGARPFVRAVDSSAFVPRRIHNSRGLTP